MTISGILGIMSLLQFSILIFLGFEIFSIIIFRIFVRYRWKISGTEAVKYLISNNDESPVREFVSNPYSLYWNTPNWVVNGIKQTDSRGYRSHSGEISELPGEGIYRILALGGSTTFSNHFFESPKDAWPAILERILKDKYNLQCEVINAGLNYAMTPELISHYMFYGQHLNPDLIILDGPGNDFLPIAVGDNSYDYRHTRKSIYFQKRKYEKQALKISGSLRLLYSFWVSTSRLLKLEPPYFNFGSNPNHNENLLESNANVLKLNLTTIARYISQIEKKLLLIDFMYTAPLELRKFHPNTYKGLLAFNYRASDIMSKIAKDFGDSVSHLDFKLEDKFEGKFHDSCHLNLEGEKIKAELIGRRISDILGLDLI